MVSILLTILWSVCVVLGAFVMWRRLRTELDEDFLMQSIIGSLLGGLIVGRTVWWLWHWQEPGWGLEWWWNVWAHQGIDIWGMLVGAWLAVWRPTKGIKKVAGEMGDAYMEAVGLMLMVIAYGERLITMRWQRWWVPIIMFVIVPIWYWFRTRYRSFTWYPSGKMGFMWWLGILLIGVGQLLTMEIPVSVYARVVVLLYFAVPVILSVVGIYRLSGRSWGRDTDDFWKRLRIYRTILRQKIRKRGHNSGTTDN